MPSFIPRLRSVRRSSRSSRRTDGQEQDNAPSPSPTTPVTAVEAPIEQEPLDADADAPSIPASPRTPVALTLALGLDSKIHPDLSALFASVEEAVKPRDWDETRDGGVRVYEEGGNEDEDEDENGVEEDGKESDGHGHGRDWPTFGREALGSAPDLQLSIEPFTDELRTRTRTTSDVDEPRRVMSWSPAVEGTDVLGDGVTTASSASSPTSLYSPDTDTHQTQAPAPSNSTVFNNSPAPGTFGRPTPYGTPSQGVIGNGNGSGESVLPPLPFPTFHSTPRMSGPAGHSSLRSISMYEPPTSGRSGSRRPGLGLPIPAANSPSARRTRRTQSDRPPLSTVFASSPLNEMGVRERERRQGREQQQRERAPLGPKSCGLDVNTSTSGMGSTWSRRDPRRRKSAEWNAHAAETGVLPSPTGERNENEFGWQAEVAHEILRLSLGGEHTKRAAPPAVRTPTATTTKSAPSTLTQKRRVDHVDHPEKENSPLPRASAKNKNKAGTSRERRRQQRRRRTASSPQHTTTPSPIPRIPLQDVNAQGRVDTSNPASATTQLPTQSRLVPTAHPQRARSVKPKTHTRARSATTLDTKSKYDDRNGNADVGTGRGTGTGHRRAGSEGKVDWSSQEVQDFLSYSGNGQGDSEPNDGDDTRPKFDLHALQHSTPIKKTDSESTYETAGSSSYLHAPSLSVIAASPQASAAELEPGLGSGEVKREGSEVQVSTPAPSEKSKGKRKVDETEDSPPDLRSASASAAAAAIATESARGRKTSFAASRPQRPLAPSSFPSSQSQSQKSRKRVRLSSPADAFGVLQQLDESGTTPRYDSYSSHNNTKASVRSTLSPPSHSQSYSRSYSRGGDKSGTGVGVVGLPRPPSRASRASRAMSGTSSAAGRSANRRSLSQSSTIPFSAIIAPHPPSIDRLSTFHMRDPHKLPPRRDVGWALRFAGGGGEEKGSPVGAWCFWFGFVCPVLWWLASFWRVPKTRMVGGESGGGSDVGVDADADVEKAVVVVDDPHIEREARAWRLRCRIASALFFVTYLPVVVLLAIFAPR